jgi:hypothetical protein
MSILISTFFDTLLRRFHFHQRFQPLARLVLWPRTCAYQFVASINVFKISIIDNRSQRRLVVEGRLTEPWVDELRATWKNANRDLDGRRLVIDVGSLTVISREGEDAIFDLMKEGAKFSRGDVLTRHVLKRLARRCRHQP